MHVHSLMLRQNTSFETNEQKNEKEKLWIWICVNLPIKNYSVTIFKRLKTTLIHILCVFKLPYQLNYALIFSLLLQTHTHTHIQCVFFRFSRTSISALNRNLKKKKEKTQIQNGEDLFNPYYTYIFKCRQQKLCWVTNDTLKKK